MRIDPASVAFLDDGTPFSAQFGDVYHAAAGGLAQSRHVFLGGNGLPQRWRDRARFTILETGFGLGTNFLATWHAWRDDSLNPSCARLFYVAIDLHPPRRADLIEAHAHSELRPLADALVAAWPPLVRGLHRRTFDEGRVVLLLGWGDAATLLPQLACRADAIYLDGFAPARNPHMWTPKVIAQLARLSASGATAATWSAARPVRDALTRAGFEIRIAPGFAGKRDMTTAHARFTRASDASEDTGSAAPSRPTRRALVVGAGLGGCAAAHALAARGFDVTVLDRADAVAHAASGNPIGALQPLVARDDNRSVRFTRAAFLDAVVRIERLGGVGAWAQLDGLLYIARDDEDFESMRVAARTHGAPNDVLALIERDEARRRTGVAVPRGGWWFARGGWVIPPRYAQAMLDAERDRIDLQLNAHVARIEREGSRWQAFDASGHILAQADTIVLAAAEATADLAASIAQVELPMQRIRGQLTRIDAARIAAPRVPISGDGYVMPIVAEASFAGSTYEFDDDPSAQLRAEAQQENIARIARLTGQAVDTRAAPLAGRVAWRALAPDRLPLVGPLADAAPPHAVHEGLYVLAGLGSRGIAWAGLAGELLAAQICGEPWPVERDLAEAVAPVRFARRRAQRPPKRL